MLHAVARGPARHQRAHADALAQGLRAARLGDTHRVRGDAAAGGVRADAAGPWLRDAGYAMRRWGDALPPEVLEEREFATVSDMHSTRSALNEFMDRIADAAAPFAAGSMTSKDS